MYLSGDFVAAAAHHAPVLDLLRAPAAQQFDSAVDVHQRALPWFDGHSRPEKINCVVSLRPDHKSIVAGRQRREPPALMGSRLNGASVMGSGPPVFQRLIIIVATADVDAAVNAYRSRPGGFDAHTCPRQVRDVITLGTNDEVVLTWRGGREPPALMNVGCPFPAFGARKPPVFER